MRWLRWPSGPSSLCLVRDGYGLHTGPDEAIEQALSDCAVRRDASGRICVSPDLVQWRGARSSWLLFHLVDVNGRTEAGFLPPLDVRLDWRNAAFMMISAGGRGEGASTRNVCLRGASHEE